MMQQSEQELRALICRIGQLMYQNGYIDGTSGNISARLDSNCILTTPSGLAKGFMQPEQLIIVNLDGERVDEPNIANEHLRPTSEIYMHLECYRQRSDVNGVVHAHPPTAVALTLTGYDFQQCIIPEMIVILGLIPTAPYSTPASPENRDAITELITEHDAIMLAHHGSLTVADTLWNAYLKLESLEHGATILHRAEQIGGVKSTIPPQQVEKLLDQREKMGLMRTGDRERFAKVLSSPII
jgi:L-fuculose-phosphate aldolase